MKNFVFVVLASLALASTAFASNETGPAYTVLRVPSAGGRAKFGALDLSQSAARTGTLPTGSGGTNVASSGTAGNGLISNGTNWISSAISSAKDLRNVGLSAAISSNTLVVSLKQADGSTDCTAAAPCLVGFRATSATAGGYSQASFTAAASITLATTDSIGTVASVAFPIWAYLVSDTTSEICLSRSHFDEGTLQNASALTGGADVTATTLWCTSAHTGKPVRKLGRIMATWSNPNWGSLTEAVIDPIDNGCLHKNGYVDECTESAYVTNNGTCAISTQSGAWLSSTSNTAAGQCSHVVAAGVFSVAPRCVANGVTNAANPFTRIDGATTTTLVKTRTVNTSAGGTGENDDVSFICQGQR